MNAPSLPASSPSNARLHPIGEGLYLISCTNELAHYEVLTQGAQLLRWHPIGQSETVWTSPHARFLPGKPPRGGTPICWPWFGPHVNPDFPAHGLVRAREWQLEAFSRTSDGSDILSFSTRTDANTSPLWPHSARLNLTYQIGTSLILSLETINEDSHPLSITEAVHTYFGVGDVRDVSVEGLDGCTYLDRLDADARKTQQGKVTIKGETDRVYLDTGPNCAIHDPILKRVIHISSKDAKSKVVWNPWIEKAAKLGDLGDSDYLKMVCVESGNIADDEVVIAPGERHCLNIEYSIQPSA